MAAIEDECWDEGNQELKPSDQGNKTATTPTIEEDPADKMSTKTALYLHDTGNILAEDVDQYMAILPEVVITVDVDIEDIQVGDPGIPLTDDQEKLKQLIWKNRHLLIGKGNDLPPAARGEVCDN